MDEFVNAMKLSFQQEVFTFYIFNFCNYSDLIFLVEHLNSCSYQHAKFDEFHGDPSFSLQCLDFELPAYSTYMSETVYQIEINFFSIQSYNKNLC